MIQDDKSKLEKFHGMLLSNKNIVGIPESYEQFSSKFDDDEWIGTFYETLKSNPNIQGLPDDLDAFYSGLELKKKVQSPDGGAKPPASDSAVLSTSSEVLPDDAYRQDGSLKDTGFLGPLDMKDGSGRIATEISVGVPLDGVETEIPLLVPTLDQEEIDFLLSNGGSWGDLERNDGEMAAKIINKAIAHARERKKQGLSPFFDSREEKADKDVSDAESLVGEGVGGMRLATDQEIDTATGLGAADEKIIKAKKVISLDSRIPYSQKKKLDPFSARTIERIESTRDIERNKEITEITAQLRSNYRGNLMDKTPNEIEELKRKFRDQGRSDEFVEAAFLQMEAEDKLLLGSSYITEQYANEVVKRSQAMADVVEGIPSRAPVDRGATVSDGRSLYEESMDVVYTRAIAEGLDRFNDDEMAVYEANQVIQEIENSGDLSPKNVERLRKAKAVREQQGLENQFYNWKTGKSIGQEEAAQVDPSLIASSEEINRLKDVYSILSLSDLEETYFNLWAQMKSFERLSQESPETGREVPFMEGLRDKGMVSPVNVTGTMPATRFEYNEKGEHYLNQYRDVSLKFKAAADLLLLNKSPQDIKKGFKYYAGAFIRPAIDVLAGEEMYKMLEETSNRPMTVRKELDVLQSLSNEKGIQFSDEELERMDRGFATHLAEMGGGLIGFMGLMYPANAAGKASGLNRAVQVLRQSKNKYNKLFGLVSAMALEEAKFQAIAGGQAGMGSGLVLGQEAIPSFSFGKGPIGRVASPYFNALFKASVGGTVGMELGVLSETFIESLAQNKDFKYRLKEAGFTGDSEMFTRLGAEFASNLLLGFGHIKSAKEASEARMRMEMFKQLADRESKRYKEATLDKEEVSAIDKAILELKTIEEGFAGEGKAKTEEFFSDPKNKESLDVIDKIEKRITEAEYINKNEITEAQEKILELIDKAETPEMERALSETFDKLENYEFTTETKSGTVTERQATTVRKKSPRVKVTPIQEKVTGKEVVTEDGVRGVMKIEARPDGKEYIVIETKDKIVDVKEQKAEPVEYRQSVDENGNIFYEEIRGDVSEVTSRKKRVKGETKGLLGETSKVSLETAEINYDKQGNPVSITGKTESGRRFTIKDKELAENELLERAKKEELANDQFETIYKEVEKQVEAEVLVEGKPGVSETTTLREKATMPQVKEQVTEVKPKEVKEDAVQEQATGEVPIQPKAEGGKEVQGRAPETKPKEVAEAGKEAKVEMPESTAAKLKQEAVKQIEVESKAKDLEAKAKKAKTPEEKAKMLEEAKAARQKRLDEVETRIQERLSRLANVKNVVADGKKPDILKDVTGLIFDLAEVGRIKITEKMEKIGSYLEQVMGKESFAALDWKNNQEKVRGLIEKGRRDRLEAAYKAKIEVAQEKIKAEIKEVKEKAKAEIKEVKEKLNSVLDEKRQMKSDQKSKDKLIQFGIDMQNKKYAKYFNNAERKFLLNEIADISGDKRFIDGGVKIPFTRSDGKLGVKTVGGTSMKIPASERMQRVLDVVESAENRYMVQRDLEAAKRSVESYKTEVKSGVKVSPTVSFVNAASTALRDFELRFNEFNAFYDKALGNARNKQIDRIDIEAQREGLNNIFYEGIEARMEAIDARLNDMTTVDRKAIESLLFEQDALMAARQFEIGNAEASREAAMMLRERMKENRLMDAEKRIAREAEFIESKSEFAQLIFKSSKGKGTPDAFTSSGEMKADTKKKRPSWRIMAKYQHVNSWLGDIGISLGTRKEMKLYGDPVNQLFQFHKKYGVQTALEKEANLKREYIDFKREVIEPLIGKNKIARDKNLAEMNVQNDTGAEVQMLDGSTMKLRLTKAQAMGHLYMISDPYTHSSYFRPIEISESGRIVGMGFTPKTVEALKQFVGPKNLEIIETFKPMLNKLAKEADAVHIERTGTSFLINPDYSATSRKRMVSSPAKTESIFEGMPSAKGGHFNRRSGSVGTYDNINFFDLVDNYSREMINYSSFENLFRMWNSVFGNSNVKRTLGERFSPEFVEQYKWHLTNILGKSQSEYSSFVDWMGKNIRTGLLGVTFSPAVKQLVSSVNYLPYVTAPAKARFMSEVGVEIPISLLNRGLGAKPAEDVNLMVFDMIENHWWVKERKLSKDVYTGVDFTVGEKQLKELKGAGADGTRLEAAFNTLKRIKQGQVDPYSKAGKDAVEFVSTYLLSKGDLMPIVIAGTSYLKRQYRRLSGEELTGKAMSAYLSGKTNKHIEQALQDWYTISEATQQSMNKTNQAEARVANAAMRNLVMFSSAQYQQWMNRRYHRKALAQALRNRKGGQALSHLGAVAHFSVVIPGIISLINSNFRLDDESGNVPEELITDVVIGAIADGLPAAQQIAYASKNLAFNKAYGKDADLNAVYGLLEDFITQGDATYKALRDKSVTNTEKRKQLYKFGAQALVFYGVNAPATMRLYDNWSTIGESQYPMVNALGRNPDYLKGKPITDWGADFNDYSYPGESGPQFYERLRRINETRGERVQIDLDDKEYRKTYDAIYKASQAEQYIVVDYLKEFEPGLRTKKKRATNFDKLVYLQNIAKDEGLTVHQAALLVHKYYKLSDDLLGKARKIRVDDELTKESYYEGIGKR